MAVVNILISCCDLNGSIMELLLKSYLYNKRMKQIWMTVNIIILILRHDHISLYIMYVDLKCDHNVI